MSKKDSERVSFYTRNGHDWSDRFPAIAEEIRRLSAHSLWLDRELVVLRDDGRSCFGSLQHAVARRDQAVPIYSTFDLMHLDDRNLCDDPLKARKRLLYELIGAGDGISGTSTISRGRVPLFSTSRAPVSWKVSSQRKHLPGISPGDRAPG
ncbi:ATP-dependent DNA ligase [Geomonas sp. RF6]|uniref:ATP-dependent DNA ligase n=1 Tax=Geomonas sp. RF6 TaxID=2897342 RepID=UPI003FA5F15B